MDAPVALTRGPSEPEAAPLTSAQSLAPGKRRPFPFGLSGLSLVFWAVLLGVAIPLYYQAAAQTYTQVWSTCTNGCCTTGSCAGPAEALLLPIQGFWLWLFGLASLPLLYSLLRKARERGLACWKAER